MMHVEKFTQNAVRSLLSCVVIRHAELTCRVGVASDMNVTFTIILRIPQLEVISTICGPYKGGQADAHPAMPSPFRPRDFRIALSFSLKAYPVIDAPAGWCAVAVLLPLSWHSLVLFECSDVPGAMRKTAHKVMLCTLSSPTC